RGTALRGVRLRDHIHSPEARRDSVWGRASDRGALDHPRRYRWQAPHDGRRSHRPTTDPIVHIFLPRSARLQSNDRRAAPRPSAFAGTYWSTCRRHAAVPRLAQVRRPQTLYRVSPPTPRQPPRDRASFANAPQARLLSSAHRPERSSGDRPWITETCRRSAFEPTRCDLQSYFSRVNALNGRWVYAPRETAGRGQ